MWVGCGGWAINKNNILAEKKQSNPAAPPLPKSEIQVLPCPPTIIATPYQTLSLL
ncbi:hypothetical protein BDR22DRAFT_836218 [Usnea florida]